MHYNAVVMEDQLTVRLPRDLSLALERAARQLHRKNAEVVRMALRQFLEVPHDAGRPVDRVRNLLGTLDSGEPDLAADHRERILESLKRAR
jgi:Arc/MetJ-type ribon-helix-helix transcriptional regulator